MAVARPYRSRTTARPVATEPQRSHAAIPVAIVLVAAGLYLGTYTVLVTALFGLVLLASAGSLLSTRLNPLSATYYLSKKPSFLAIAVVFLGALVLFGGAYALWLHQMGPLVPRT
ncbi:MAG: hypothetical protein WBF81_01640 [Thermoplasmata archaeon]